VESTNKLLPLLKGTTPLNVFKNYPAGKITVLDRVPLSTTYKYIEDREKPEWKMEPGNLTVCGYECRKATTSFRGRHYTAWYAPEIAVSEGPWKFWGLPGLILKVEDDRGHYTFEGVAIEKARGIVPIYILDQTYINTTKARFNKALKNFYDNPGGTIQASGVVQGGLPDNIQSRPYNPIELTDE
jgi:GLPGLI family protein